METIPPEVLLDLRDLEARWRVSKRKVQREIAAGRLRCVRIGRQLRFRMADVLLYEEQS